MKFELKRVICSLALIVASTNIYAQITESGDPDDGQQAINTFRLETRFDFNHMIYEDRSDKGGFEGKYLNLILAGNITKNLSYSYRQRILPNTGEKTFFDGTDWLYLDWRFAKNFSISAGKQVFLVGGVEYDKAPIDVYYWSGYCTNVRCYQLGATLSYTDDSRRNTLSFQFANSNYTDRGASNLYAYNLIWYGDFGCFKPIYSLNAIEYASGRYIYYMALGNKFRFGNFGFYVDLMNRTSRHQHNIFLDDFSVGGRADWTIRQRWNIFMKGGYDTNRSLANNDIFVEPGTEYHFYGGGVEFYPMRGRKDLRLHAFCAASCAATTDIQLNVGLTWRIDIIRQLRNLLHKKQ